MELRIERTWNGEALPAEETASISLCWEGEELVLRVKAPYAGDPPPEGPPGPVGGLWDFEVVELFLVGQAERYTEIELGPHGHHLVLRLEGVRAIVEQELAIDFEAMRHGSHWSGVARIPAELIPDPIERLNAFAIRGTGAQRSYMAWSPVPGEAPDFHRIGLFPAWGEVQR